MSGGDSKNLQGTVAVDRAVTIGLLWAYERVIDIVELKRSAVQAGLTWPDGSIFARTEIKSRAHRQREREFERHAGRVDLDP
jgi:hypothetical protein